MNKILQVDGLGQSFKSMKALQGVSFSLGVGDRLAVLGASGSGKTTLLRLIAGLEAPAEGSIHIAGQEVSRAGEVTIAPECRGVAMVFQGLALFPHLNALAQIAFAARGRGGLPKAKELLERIGLGHRANAQLDQLSGGERQRIALARAIAQEPKLILMDEPFASLDDEKRAEMRDLLRALLETGETTLVLVTHSRDDAFDLARNILVLEKGKPVVYDLLESVLARPRHIAAARALGLGQVLEAEVTAPGEAQTAFGKVCVPATAQKGTVLILVRPGQPQIATDSEGVEAEVVSIELRPSDLRAGRRIAVTRVAGKLLRLFAPDDGICVRRKIRIRIKDECEMLEG